MTIWQRLKNVEKKAGAGDKPLLVLLRTIYENKDGSDGGSYSQGVIIHGNNSECVPSNEGESKEDFEARVRKRCFELTGQYPEEE